MPRSQRNDNFIDKTFTIIADLLLQRVPTPYVRKEAFAYYRNGLIAQSEGEYAEALRNYYKALRIETDPFDRRYIFYNIGLIHTANGQNSRALDYYFAALERNPTLTQALNNVAILYYYQREKALELEQVDLAPLLFSRASEYWQEAIRLAPTNYIEAQNWLLTKKVAILIYKGCILTHPINSFFKFHQLDFFSPGRTP
jgi:tetratricopeptide (TPR) repeat protein